MSVAARPNSTVPQGHELICWTRMQSEAGQGLDQIIARKELERRAGDGFFFWGVGNPPAVATSTYARLRRPVTAVFSIMKSRPRAVDVAPRSLLVWRRYLDMHGLERELPANVLVTSRGESEASEKRRHYALMCYSARSLRLERGVGFDPSAYRNVGGNGGPVGASQVTALLQKVGAGTDWSYEANLTAQLIGSYWVKLTDPVALNEAGARRLNTAGDCSSQEWRRMVSELREGPRLEDPEPRQRSFF